MSRCCGQFKESLGAGRPVIIGAPKKAKNENSILKTPRVFPSLIMLNYALWGGSHASGASFLHNFAVFLAKLRPNCKIRALISENRTALLEDLQQAHHALHRLADRVEHLPFLLSYGSLIAVLFFTMAPSLLFPFN